MTYRDMPYIVIFKINYDTQTCHHLVCDTSSRTVTVYAVVDRVGLDYFEINY